MNSVDLWALSLFPTLTDYVIIGVYLILIYLYANYVKNKKAHENPAYKYFTLGLFARIFGAIALGLIYTLYYKEGGDTTGYFRSSLAMVNLLFEDPGVFFKMLMGNSSSEVINSFTSSTGYPMFRGKFSSFAVVRITSIASLLGFKSYFTSTILFATFFYIGHWKLFLLATRLYPKYQRPLAFAILFFPSVIFWGSGISKDAIALSMTGLFVYSAYTGIILKEKVFRNILSAAFSAFLILSVKPYVFVALVPGVFLYYAWANLKKIRNVIFRFVAAPLTLALFIMLGLGFLTLFSPFLGEYGSMEGIIKKAIITYEDHSRIESYGENMYSLGAFDGTRLNFFSKAPKAIIAGLFRPYLWEVRNPVMLISALENTFLMVFFLVILWRTGVVKTFQIIFDEPLVVFSLSFALVFAFAVGISTANFGALVRLRIPQIPFLTMGLIILYYKSQEIKMIRSADERKTFALNK